MKRPQNKIIECERGRRLARFRRNSIVFASLLVVFCGFRVGTAHAVSWYDANWTHRNQITIDSSKVGSTTEDELDFPVLISLSGLSSINTSGTDIRFTSSDGVTPLAREIESYSGGTLVAWVKVPTLSHTASTSIYMYYGNPSATEPAATSTYGSQNVWMNGFAGVWHLSDNSGTLNTNDSTANGNNGTNNGVTATSSGIFNGAGAGSFNGTSAYVASTFAQPITSAFTVSGWVNLSAWRTAANTGSAVYTQRTGCGGTYGIQLYAQCSYSGCNGNAVLNAGTDVGEVNATTAFNTSTWYFLSGTYNGSSAILYINGVQNQVVNTSAYTFPSVTQNNIGWDTCSTNYFPGLIDDARILNVALSPSWILTEYNNQSSPSTFYTIGSEVTVPDAPTGLTATFGNTQVALSWTSPANNGGLAITDYVIGYKLTASSTWSTFADGVSTSTTGTVTGLTNGSSYDFRVSAVNAAGQGSASSVASATPATVPDAPTAVSAVAGNTQATISFTAPANGGSAITGYTVTSNPGGFTGTGSSSPVTVTGLTNGATYTFTVTATNVAGTGAASSPSNSVTLPTLPGSPVNLAATVGGSSIGLSWSAPASDGGSSITDYVVEYKLTIGGTWSVFADGLATSTTATVTSLSDGTSYDFRVSAVNNIGQGSSSASVMATPGEPAQVLIQIFSDLTTPSIGTAVRITNEGSVDYEYQYTWCVTASAGVPCGSNNDVSSATAAKLIGAGQNFDTTLASTVLTPGSYWFTIIVVYGSASSRATQLFTAVNAAPSGGGGSEGGGGGGQMNIVLPVPTPSVNTGIASSSSTAITIAHSIAVLKAQLAALKSQLASLFAQLASMNSSPNPAFIRNLRLGSTGSDVKKLQLFLISKNSGPAAQKLKVHGTTTTFGFLTYNALVEFQKKAGITPASGYFGPITRAYANTL
ncbi:MAG: DUF2341 domain-containing protein [bacterium]|nr:DUF2341 domain-containing protein [bacterium]